MTSGESSFRTGPAAEGIAEEELKSNRIGAIEKKKKEKEQPDSGGAHL